jgi:hypothetical protein
MHWNQDICPYCRSAISVNDNLVVCKSCKTLHHQICWNANHKCTVFGCRGKKSIAYGKSKKTSVLKQSTTRSDKIGRNDLCPCSSNRKYKDCCLKKVEEGITILAPGKGGSGGRRPQAAFETYAGKKSR